MIINIKAQSGAGKSTAVKHYSDTLKLTRTLPGTPCMAQEFGNVVILGDYRRYPHTSGCDAYRSNQQLIDVVEQYHKRHYHVLFESMMFSRTTAPNLHFHKQGYPQQVIELTTSTQQAADNRRKRQQQVGSTKEMATATGITSKKEIETLCSKLTQQGLQVIQLPSVEQAVAHIQHTFGETSVDQFTAEARHLMWHNFTTATSEITKRKAHRNWQQLEQFLE